MIDYHPTDADADLIVQYIVKNVDDYIQHWLNAHPSGWPKIICEYSDQTGKTFPDCCETNFEEIFANEWQGGLDNTVIVPSKEGAWGEVKEMSLDEYLDIHSDRIYNHIACAGFINHWIDDLSKYSLPSFAELIIKINIRLATKMNSPEWTIRNEMISRVYYHLHSIVEDNI